jgi:hypothetical protein
MPKSQPANPDDKGDSTNDGIRRSRSALGYAGLASQMAVSVAISVWLGIKADKWLKLSFPIFSLVVPLLVITGLLVQLVKANSGKKNEK